MEQSKPAALIEAVYRYTDEAGTVLFERVKKPKGKVVLRKQEGEGYTYRSVLDGVVVPLYNLPAVLEAVRDGEPVAICQTEDEVDRLKLLGVVATTNCDRPGKWRTMYSEWLRGNQVYILEPNSVLGRQRSDFIAKRLKNIALTTTIVRFQDLAEGQGVCDYLDQGYGLHDLVEKMVSCPVVEADPPGSEKKTAVYADYVQLFNTVLDSPRRDIFTGKLMTLDRGIWQSARNYSGILKSHAAVIQETTGLRFQRPVIDDHLDHFEAQQDPELLIDIPTWDGHDYIKDFTDCLSLKEDSFSQQEDLEHWVKWWISTAMQKIEQPRIQNRILILHGKQGWGKDTWIDSLLCGAGQFVNELNVVSGDKDTFLALHSSLFLKISEFEKTARTEVSLLKDLITTPSTNLRAPYDRDNRRRESHASFISSSNEDNLLRDPTGARRYLIFELSEIKWSYPVMDLAVGAQVLAQAQALAGYKVPAKSLQRMTVYLEENTPDDPASTCVTVWCDLVTRWIKNNPVEASEVKSRGWIYNGECADLILDTAKHIGVKPVTVRAWLKNRKMTYRDSWHRGYLFNSQEVTTDPENI